MIICLSISLCMMEASKEELESWLDQIEIACQIAGREQDIKR